MLRVDRAIGLVEGAGGNVGSVRAALGRLGVDVIPVSDPHDLIRCRGIVLPGVGAFPAVMSHLRRRGLDVAIRSAVAEGSLLLGICAGMQILADAGEEGGGAAGLGLIPGRVRRLAVGCDQRLPHVGWSDVSAVGSSALMDEGSVCCFYFTHSYAFVAEDAGDVVGEAIHGERFAAVIERGGVMGVQFHPEKSQRDGLRLLGRFVERVNAASPMPREGLAC